MTTTRLARIDTGQINERILSKQEYRADFRRVEGASLKRKTTLASPEGKRLFARCFYSLQASMYFISHLGRAKLDHALVERIEDDVRAALEAGAKEIDDAIDQAEALLKHHAIETLASYDTVPLVEEIGITSSFGRRYFELIHKLDVIMPMLETLAIEEVITEREHELRRSRFKRVVLSVSTRARNFWSGLRRRMNEQDARAAAVAAKGRAPASGAAPDEASAGEPAARVGQTPAGSLEVEARDAAPQPAPGDAQDATADGGRDDAQPLEPTCAEEAAAAAPERTGVAAAA